MLRKTRFFLSSIVFSLFSRVLFFFIPPRIHLFFLFLSYTSGCGAMVAFDPFDKITTCHPCTSSTGYVRMFRFGDCRTDPTPESLRDPETTLVTAAVSTPNRCVFRFFFLLALRCGCSLGASLVWALSVCVLCTLVVRGVVCAFSVPCFAVGIRMSVDVFRRMSLVSRCRCYTGGVPLE